MGTSWARRQKARARWGTVVTAIPQGAASGFGSYIVGQAAKYYFEHGSSWGSESPKSVAKRILKETDKKSVLDRLKGEILNRLKINPYGKGTGDREQGTGGP